MHLRPPVILMQTISSHHGVGKHFHVFSCLCHLSTQTLEVSEYDTVLSKLQKASIKTEGISATLNAGQSVILSFGANQWFTRKSAAVSSHNLVAQTCCHCFGLVCAQAGCKCLTVVLAVAAMGSANTVTTAGDLLMGMLAMVERVICHTRRNYLTMQV